MNILITGGTGFIGQALVNYYRASANKIVILTRQKRTSYHQIQMIHDLSSISSDTKFDVIVNLAGAPIDRRWTKSYQKELIESRVKITQSVVDLTKRLKHKPGVIISASAIGYYGSEQTDPIDEDSGFLPSFTHELCLQWEQAVQELDSMTRLCIIRLGVVLGRNGGMLKKILLPFRFGFGGKLGTGRQYLSWIHLADVVEIIDFLIHSESKGVFNVTAPNPIRNNDFTACLGKLLHRPTFFAIPQLIIKALYGEMGMNLLLQGNQVLPKRLVQGGYVFRFSKIEQALSNILSN